MSLIIQNRKITKTSSKSLEEWERVAYVLRHPI
uniref:Uncharacterized protein n=1 Tax=Rhizophora mucronata TaxID=61149 RepID=A0A2P2QAG0_RHIMU